MVLYHDLNVNIYKYRGYYFLKSLQYIHILQN